VNGFSLIETMRFTPGEGIGRLRLHMARLGNSSRKLGFSGFESARAALQAHIEGLTEPSRVRLELFGDGHADITSAAFTGQPAGTVWRVAIASTVRLCSSEPLLRHKTSMRAAYDTARAEFDRAHCDEVLLLNDRGEVCEGTITNLFVGDADGTLITPPLSSGCLAGVLRTALLCQKRARVGAISLQQLETQPFYVGNALRGLIAARLIT